MIGFPFDLTVVMSFKVLLFGFIALFVYSSIDTVKLYLWKKKIRLPWLFIEMISYYLFALFMVILAAAVGPYVIEHFTNYIIDTPYKMTASDATYYTLQALIAIVIGKYVAEKR
jgi:hypothetical protein